MGWTRFRLPNDVQSPLGAIPLAGEVHDDVPHVPGPYRKMDSWILSVVTAGVGTYRGDDGAGHAIGPGSALLVPPGEPHWYGTTSSEGLPRRWSELFVVFAGPLFDALAAAGTLLPRTPAPLGRAGSVELLRAVIVSEPTDRAGLDRRLLALAGWLAELRVGEGGRGPPGGAEDSLRQAGQELAADLRAELDLHVLAKRTGLSYDVFRHRFAAEHGRPPAAHRNEARLAAAAQLLALTDLGQREIARRLGYSDEFHLSRRFRERFGVPPGRYRRG